jgi:hypothetical protein
LSEAISQAETIAVLNQKFEQVNRNIAGIYEEISKIEDDAVQRQENRKVTLDGLLHPQEVNEQYDLILMDTALTDSRDLFTKIRYDKTDDQRYSRLRCAIGNERDRVAADLTLYEIRNQKSPLNAEMQSERAALNAECSRDEKDLGEPIEWAVPTYVQSLISRAKREQEEKERYWQIGIYAGWFLSFLTWCISLKMGSGIRGEKPACSPE